MIKGLPIANPLEYAPELLNVARIILAQKDVHGYGVISGAIPEGLRRAGANMLESRACKWDCRLAISTPMGWLAPGMKMQEDLCLHTMFDADLLPDEWVKIINLMGLVWVPSRWCEETFRASGVTRPIMVAGYGVDAEEFSYAPRGWLAGESAYLRNDEYTFVTVVAGWGGRKNPDAVCKAFIRADMPGAKLVVKMRDGGRAFVDDMVTNKNIRFVVDEAGRGAYSDLLASADCFVGASSGEGFSLTPLEAMATGLPAIALDYGGPRDYIDALGAIPVRVERLEWARLYNLIFRGEGRWAVPDVGDLAEKMRWCWSHRAEAAEMGRRASAIVRERYTWEAAMSVAHGKLCEYYKKENGRIAT